MKKCAFIRKTLRAVFNSIIWHVGWLFPRNKNKWVFGSWFGDRYSDNSRAMYEYVLKEMPYIKAMWLTRNIEVYHRLKEEGKPVELLSSFKGKMFSLTSKVAFITVEREEVNGIYLNGAKIVWLYHGMPMKYIMNDESRFLEKPSEGKTAIRKKILKILFPYLTNYNVGSVIATSEFFRPFLETAFKVDANKVWCDGYPRNDELFSSETEELIKKYRSRFPSSKFIIHMPTHRIHGMNGEPYNPFEGYGFNQNSFIETIEKGDYVYFYKGHFYDSKNRFELKHERFVRITDNDFDVLYRLVKDMDVLITDYSSIYFDYLLLQRPIILTPFDYEEYVSNERPLYYDYNDNIVANRVSDWNELLMMLLENTYVQPEIKLINKYHLNIDGFSCKRIAEHIENLWM